MSVDLKMALEAFGRSYYLFARSTEELEPALIRELLHALVKRRPRDPGVLFLQTAFDDRNARESWQAAVNALRIFGAFYKLGSKSKLTRMTEVARNPRLLAATQTAAVGAREVPDEYLAVLAVDGSDTSIDALLPHFAAAMKDPTRLDGLARLEGFAKNTPALTALLAEVKERVEARQAALPTLTLARELHLATGPRFRVHVSGQEVEANKTSFDVLLDSAAVDDHRVWVFGEAGSTTFNASSMTSDDLLLGRCTLPELPQWLAGTQEKLKIRWTRQAIFTEYMRGKRLAIFVDWLLGPSNG